jgi:Carboxypeptidase regulatory-like domain
MALDLRIASPCTADWDRMVGDDRSRHCAQCNLSVYNFAELTHAEIEKLVATREGRLCARLYRRADGTMITKDCPVGFQMKVRRISRIAGVALSAAMTAIPAVAQTPLMSKSAAVHIAPHAANLEVEVTDPTGAVIPNALVTLIDSSTAWETEQRTDSTGRARLLDLPAGRYKIEVASSGFRTADEIVTLSAGENVSVETRLDLGLLMGDVVEVDASAHKKHVPKSDFQSGDSEPSKPGKIQKILRKLHL